MEELAAARPRRRKQVFIVCAIAVGVLAACLSAEVALRVLFPWPDPQALDIIIEPGGKYQSPDSELGFLPLPGRYRALFDHQYPWTLTNLPDTTRITKPLEHYAGASPKPGIWVFGCSFTQGWGLDDDGTLPWKLQERSPDHDVFNFGVGGYGTLQSLLQYRRALRDKPRPQIAILVYADFHDERNVGASSWREANFSYERFGTTAQPYARLDGAGGVRYGWDTGEFPWMRLRARSMAIDEAMVRYGQIRDRFLRAHRVSEVLIEQFIEESRRYGVRFVLAGVEPSEATRDTLRQFAAHGVLTVDVSTDREDERNVIAFDGHPSAFANEQSAVKLAAALR